MDTNTVNAFIAIAAALGQFGVAVAAFKLANALKSRVDNHEVRIVVVENKAK